MGEIQDGWLHDLIWIIVCTVYRRWWITDDGQEHKKGRKRNKFGPIKVAKRPMTVSLMRKFLRSGKASIKGILSS